MAELIIKSGDRIENVIQEGGDLTLYLDSGNTFTVHFRNPNPNQVETKFVIGARVAIASVSEGTLSLVYDHPTYGIGNLVVNNFVLDED